MKFIDLVLRSGRTLKSAKVRTFLTAMAIGVGGFTLVLTLAAGNGVRDYTGKLVSTNFDPAELLVGRDKQVASSSGPTDKPQEYDESIASFTGGSQRSSVQLKRVSSEDIIGLKSNPLIESVRENYQITIRYITADGQKQYTAAGEAYNSAQKPEVKAGELPKAGDIPAGTILIPDVYLDLLGFKDANDALGKKVSINVQQPFNTEGILKLLQNPTQSSVNSASQDFKPKQQIYNYTISGVTKKASTSLSFGTRPVLFSTQDAKIVYDFTVKGSADYQKFLFVYARVKAGGSDASLLAAKTSLESAGYYVQSSKDIQKTITQFVNILQIMVSVLGLITLIASVFGVVNTQYISVLERTREIGLMKALGMSRKNISWLFILEAAWIGFMGGNLGIMGGTILGILLNPWITKKLDLGAGNSLLQFSAVQMVGLLFALMLVAATAGLLPARKASKLDPVEALRTE